MVSLLVDITIIVHFLWILFLVFGFVFALKGSRITYVHLGGLVFALGLNALGWYCPLTHVENHFVRFMSRIPPIQSLLLQEA